ncbi:MAG: GNAT family N-acetyltransferase [Bacteroidetes bacterium]|nr:GNAT family N-acetyltransferase [Bacteroidota bacterium]
MKRVFIHCTGQDDNYASELRAAYERIQAIDPSVHMYDASELGIEFLSRTEADVVISNALKREHYGLLSAHKVVSITFGRLEDHTGLSDITIDRMAGDRSAHYGTEACSLANPNFDFDTISRLVKKLPWDTEFWGMGYGSIKVKTITPNIVYRAEAYAKRNDIKFLEYLCNCDDQKHLVMAEGQGFHLTDIRIDFDVKGTVIPLDPLPAGMTYGRAEERHIEELHNISKDLYKISRYYYDGGFDKSRVSDFYRTWVEKAVLGTFDHICYCIFQGDTPVGFATFRYLDNNEAMFGLGAFNENFQGAGLGRKLFRHVININAQEKGIKRVTSATQGRNIMTQRMHQAIDFRTSSVELWYHKWL